MKRFTATEKWEKPWFQDLPPRIKCLWQYICDKCDCAGVWEMNWKAASLFIGETVTQNDLSYFDKRIAVFGGKLVVGGFVEFQYGKLSDECRAHIPIFRTLAKHRLSIGYSKAIHSLQEEEEEQEEETEEEQDSVKVSKIEVTDENEGHRHNARILLESLNELTGKAYRPVPAHLDLIIHRLQEPGVTPEGVQEMMEAKAKEWKGTDFEKFLRPQTLFQKSKFAGYYDARHVNGALSPFDTRGRVMQ